MQVRLSTPLDLPFLQKMLYEAVFWQVAAPKPTFFEFSADSGFARMFAGWGRTGDTALVAFDADKNIGAAWYRFWTADDHSYGYIAPHIPELGLAVANGFRSRGVGRALLESLVLEAVDQGVQALSLSVAPANYARQLYESVGFTKVGESGTSYTYILKLTGDAESNSS